MFVSYLFFYFFGVWGVEGRPPSLEVNTVELLYGFLTQLPIKSFHIIVTLHDILHVSALVLLVS